MPNPSKDVPWQTIFDTYDINSHDFSKGPYFITADQIKSACQDFKKNVEKEPRILCYQAQKKDKPRVFNENNLFVLPVQNGKYAIIQGEGYTDIPEILSKPIYFETDLKFPLESSLVGNSEMQHLDYAFAIGMVQDFCMVGELYLTIRGRKYTPAFSFNVGKSIIHQQSVQTEVDAGYEGEKHIILIEGKNSKMKDIIIRQLFYPYKKWSIDTNKIVLPLFFEKRGQEYMFWMYKFADKEDYNSIQLVRSAKYVIKKNSVVPHKCIVDPASIGYIGYMKERKLALCDGNCIVCGKEFLRALRPIHGTDGCDDVCCRDDFSQDDFSQDERLFGCTPNPDTVRRTGVFEREWKCKNCGCYGYFGEGFEEDEEESIESIEFWSGKFFKTQ